MLFAVHGHIQIPVFFQRSSGIILGGSTWALSQHSQRIICSCARQPRPKHRKSQSFGIALKTLDQRHREEVGLGNELPNPPHKLPSEQPPPIRRHAGLPARLHLAPPINPPPALPGPLTNHKNPLLIPIQPPQRHLPPARALLEHPAPNRLQPHPHPHPHPHLLARTPPCVPLPHPKGHLRLGHRIALHQLHSEVTAGHRGRAIDGEVFPWVVGET